MFISRFNSILLFKFLLRALRPLRLAFFICLFHIPILPKTPETCPTALFLTCRRLFSSCFLDVLLSCLLSSAAALKLLLALFPLAALFALFLLLFWRFASLLSCLLSSAAALKLLLVLLFLARFWRFASLLSCLFNSALALKFFSFWFLAWRLASILSCLFNSAAALKLLLVFLLF